MKVCKYACIHKYEVCVFTLTFKFHLSISSATRTASTSLPKSNIKIFTCYPLSPFFWNILSNCPWEMTVSKSLKATKEIGNKSPFI